MKHLLYLAVVKQWRRFFQGARCERHVSTRKKTFVPSLEVLEERTALTVFTVTSLADDNVGDGNTGSLRHVINRANTLQTGTPGSPDVIDFSGVAITPEDHTIFVGAGTAGAIPLPDINVPVVIRGKTAQGFDNLAGLMLTLDGSSLTGNANGLTLDGGHATVCALEIINFPGHGILVNSSHNKIGGKEVGLDAQHQPNNPAGYNGGPVVTVRPPQGNVISGNGGDGVRIVAGANYNFLAGNFIGTDVTGLNANGNAGNGVTITGALRTRLWGTTPPDQQNPFVYYNVISGNLGHGLVIDSCKHTHVYACFFGLGMDNNTPVGNALNGVLIKGTSDHTRFGFNIPLGSVTSANGRNGLELTDSASRTLIMNTFSGVAAFNPNPEVDGQPQEVGNQHNGILVTSDGGGKFFGPSNLTTIILTNQYSGNGQNGIKIAGNATGVQVSQSVIGMQTNGLETDANAKNGIEITDQASGIFIGGFEPSALGEHEGDIPVDHPFFEAANLISGNTFNGIVVSGQAQGVKIVNSFIGTDNSTVSPAPNGRHGIYLDGVSGVQIGAALGTDSPRDRTIIAFNTQDGIRVRAGTGNSILGNSIFSNGNLGIALNQGGNLNQPAPVLTSAQLQNDGATQVNGTLTAQPNTVYQIEFFASPTGERGNGEFFLGFLEVTTNEFGIAPFAISGLTNPDPTDADFITATATSPTGNTSKFSKAFQATQT